MILSPLPDWPLTLPSLPDGGEPNLVAYASRGYISALLRPGLLDGAHNADLIFRHCRESIEGLKTRNGAGQR